MPPGPAARASAGRGVLAAAFVVGAVLVWTATPRRLGVTPDSLYYLVGAESLAAGRGFLAPPYFGGGPVTFYPPLYSAVLAVAHVVSLDPLVWARGLHAVLLGLNAAVLGGLVLRGTGSPRATVLAVALFLGSADVVSCHAFLWTEPLAVLFLLISFGTTAHAVAADSRGPLVVAAVAAALAVLTRYAALPAIVAGCVALLFLAGREWQRRLQATALYAVVAGVLLGAWFVRNRFVADNVVERSFAVHAPTAWHWQSGRESVAHWFGLPDGTPAAAAIALALLFAAICAYAIRSARRPGDSADVSTPTLPGVAGLFALLYVPFILGSITFIDVSTPLDGRILLPAYVAGLITVVCVGHRALAHRGRASHAVGVAVAWLILGGNLMRTGAWFAGARGDGLGFHARHWQESQLIDHVRTLPDDAVIYSNGPDVIYLTTGRVTAWVPRTFDRLTGARTPPDQFVAAIEDMDRRVREADGVIVYFDRMGRAYQPTDGELELLLPLQEELRADDGVVYSLRGSRRQS